MTTDRVIPSLPLDLPRAEKGSDQQTFFAVDVTKDGQVFVDGKPLKSVNELLPRARQALAANSEIRATIRADKSATHGQVMEIMDLLKQAGINKIAFSAGPKP